MVEASWGAIDDEVGKRRRVVGKGSGSPDKGTIVYL